MKRLIRKNKLYKKAEWQNVDINDPDLIQIITDVMASGTQMQLDYEGSGWRLIQPYGWNTSQDGNILIMCYKDTGEIRSYRLDRVLDILVDDSLIMNQPIDDNSLEIEDYTYDDFKLPQLPDIDSILEESENEQGQELPYGDAMENLI